MKKFIITGILLICFILFSCQPKIEKKEPTYYPKNENFKYDDEPVKEKPKDSINKKIILMKAKETKVNRNY